ncbi:MIP/aquaporin family protein [Pseudonocardia alaniniphila]|uniref:Aquaporin n=1 Tax=Pseudonocardia alaniniphila TaxID=75291 RepID=A0ABS9TMC2_9PSEU|nr:aquaporin [Pseudonocardia alaniniphila]MCH6169680.1 aquaporin [Pseudonocardia alaniniphila]
MSAPTDRPPCPPPLPLSRSLDELGLTAVLLFLVVSVVRWLRAPSSPMYVADLGIALAVVGAFSGLLLVALILSPPGRRSGGHMNPAVTIALWLMDVFPGLSVLPYVVAQLTGSVLGVVLARLTWGPIVGSADVGYAAIRPAPTWDPSAVFLAEVGCTLGLILLVGFFLAHPRWHRFLPPALAVALAAIIAFLGPLSGGSANPARQWGPALLSAQGTDLWIYLVAPVIGAVLGAGLHHLLIRRFHTHQPLSYNLSGPEPARAGAA